MARKKIKLHGCITLDVPTGMSEYEAMQLLETFLDGGPASETADLGDGVFLTDYFAGRVTSDRPHDQKTSHYDDWVKEVTS